MFSVQDNKAIALSLETLRPCITIKAAPLHIRAPVPQQTLREDELRRVQGKRVPLDLPARAQVLSPSAI